MKTIEQQVAQAHGKAALAAHDQPAKPQRRRAKAISIAQHQHHAFKVYAQDKGEDIMVKVTAADSLAARSVFRAAYPDAIIIGVA